MGFRRSNRTEIRQLHRTRDQLRRDVDARIAELTARPSRKAAA